MVFPSPRAVLVYCFPFVRSRSVCIFLDGFTTGIFFATPFHLFFFLWFGGLRLVASSFWDPQVVSRFLGHLRPLWSWFLVIRSFFRDPPSFLVAGQALVHSVVSSPLHFGDFCLVFHPPFVKRPPGWPFFWSSFF